MKFPSKKYARSPYAFKTVGTPCPLSSENPQVLKIPKSFLLTGLLVPFKNCSLVSSFEIPPYDSISSLSG